MRLNTSQKTATSALLLLSIVGCSSSSSNDTDELLTDADAVVVDTATIDTDVDAPVDDAENDDLEPMPLQAINESNFEPLATSVIDAINLTTLRTEQQNAQSLVNDIYLSGLGILNGGAALPGLALIAQSGGEADNSSPETVQDFICDAGGLLELSYFLFSGASFQTPSISFNNCTINGDTYNGNIGVISGRRVNTVVTFDSYSKSSGEQSVEINGEFTQAFGFFANTENETWTNGSLTVSGTENDLTLTNIEWQRSGTNTHFPTNTEGFVQLLDGTTALAQLFQHGANFSATMDVANSNTNFEPISVALELAFSNDYFDWSDEPFSVFSVPTFPVSDLGDPIDLFSSPDFSTANVVSVESQPRVVSPQWQSGSILLVSNDASTVSIQPDPELADSILIELNGSGVQQSALWSDGYQAYCPSVIDGCSQP